MLKSAFRRLIGPPPPVAAPGDPRVFRPTGDGSGVFGRWILDSAGLPAYEYTCDQYRERCAGYPNTEGYDRRDHWHQVGNDHITALASNDGTVQVYLCDRGGVFLNRFEPGRDDPVAGPLGWLNRLLRELVRRWQWRRAQQVMRSWAQTSMPRGAVAAQPLFSPKTPPRRSVNLFAYVGGYGYLDDGEAVWATAYCYRPAGADARRVFGMGYFETATTHRQLRVTRRVYAPYGDDPLLLTDVRLENLRTTPVSLRYYEYWDVNVHQLQLQWVRTGLAAAVGDELRRALNGQFAPGIAWDADRQALRFHQQPPPDAPPPDRISEIDWHPADVFLADLSGVVPPGGQYTDKHAFFGRGGPRQPDAVRARRDGEIGAPSTDAMPYCLVLRRDLTLPPGGQADLRYAYGAVRPEAALEMLEKYRVRIDPADSVDPVAAQHVASLQTATLSAWKEHLAYFDCGDPVLQREMAWHAYNLLSATVYSDYYRTHLTPQGSAYLYLHGADGAPRDQCLFTLPLVYLRPDLARDTLCLLMRLRHADGGALPYAFAGHGFHSDGGGIHARPSDLDLFFLLALNEYLAATGDLAFLDAQAPFYPRGTPCPWVEGTTVLDHVRVAVKHLDEGVGIGDSGLIKIGDGDWSDGVVLEAALRDALNPLGVNFDQSVRCGESVPNTQMALYVLPRTAALVEPRDPALAARLRKNLARFEEALQQQWTAGGWYARAVLRDARGKPVVIGKDCINLEAQPWALISGLATRHGHEQALVEAIQKHLDQPSPVGATLLPKGMVWPAVSQLLTWGYTRAYPQLAWQSLKKHTFAAHAEVFPKVWFNIWSGPDGVNGRGLKNPGGTWASPVTPMTDFPVMNANQDALALLALLRVCGVEPSPGGDGLCIAPHDPPGRFIFDMPLLRLDCAPGRIVGEYRPWVTGSRRLYVRLFSGAGDVRAVVAGQPVGVAPSDTGEVVLPITFEKDRVVPFEVWREA